MNRAPLWIASLGLLCMACNSPEPRLNAPPHGVAEEVNEMQSMYTYMNDNALLADMTISDIHFLPHRAILSSLGEQRLSRLASLMEAYGGEIRFDTCLDDQVLVERRTETIIDFLQDAGIDAAADVVSEGLPGGRGIDATEAILIKANEATYNPDKASSIGTSDTP